MTLFKAAENLADFIDIEQRWTNSKRVTRLWKPEEILTVLRRITDQTFGSVRLTSEEQLAIAAIGEDYCFLPASWGFHSCCAFGLFYHCVNTAKEFIKREMFNREKIPNWASRFGIDYNNLRLSAIIAFMMHDYDKIGLYPVKCVHCGEQADYMKESLLTFSSRHSVHSDKVELVYNARSLIWWPPIAMRSHFMRQWGCKMLSPASPAQDLILATCARIEGIDRACSHREPLRVCDKYMHELCGLCEMASNELGGGDSKPYKFPAIDVGLRPKIHACYGELRRLISCVSRYRGSSYRRYIFAAGDYRRHLARLADAYRRIRTLLEDLGLNFCKLDFSSQF